MATPRLLFVLALAFAALSCGDDDASAGGATETTEAPAHEPEAPTLGVDVRPPEPEVPEYDCRVPALPIPRPRACARGRGYPDCKWQIPHATHGGGMWRRWRNTIPEHMYGRPALVGLALATAREMRALFPEQVFAIGDLDAIGPRHQTHDNGVDVDLYLLGTLMTENAGGGRYPSNHEGKTPEEIDELRRIVETTARILAYCTEGQLRIYYNDPVVLERFHAWYDAHGYESPFGRPMQVHNSLHDFHFHVTIAEDMEPLEALPYTEPPPEEEIAPPPTDEEVAASDALSSRTRSDDEASPRGDSEREPEPGEPEPPETELLAAPDSGPVR